LLAVPVLALSSTAAAAQTLSLDSVFAPHMVVQQGKPIPVHGSAAPGAAVTVTFNGAGASTRADGAGRWTLRLPPQRAGSIAPLRVSSAGGERTEIADVAVGEVWLCSGQSNMDLTVRNAANPERTAREGVGPSIRLLKLRRAAAAAPASRFTPEIPWSASSSNNLPDFSAACWHMARALRAGGVIAPIGLIHAAWGGTTIEDWMSPAALRAGGTAAAEIQLLADYAADPGAAVASAIEGTDQWAARTDPGSAEANGWHHADFDDRGWATMPVPGQWERSGAAGLAGYDGVMWFRRDIDLTTPQSARGATLALGRIDERDRVWVNGQRLGATLGAAADRQYAVPPGMLRAGRNSIAVRVIDEAGGGGFSSAPEALALDLGASGKVSLAGPWRYRVGAAETDWQQPPPFLPWTTPRGLAMAWNGMIAPLGDYPLAGVAWYQGESNTARVAEYARLLTSWRSDWRRQFGDPKLPVVIVQLPGYGPRSQRPGDSGWASLREVQRLVAEGDPLTGLAVTIDLGVPGDIHPAHKDEVGARIGREALRIAYGKPVQAAPSPLSARRAGTGGEITFRSAEAGLVVQGSAEATAFEWCDAERRCNFARAVLRGSRVIVAAPALATHIRYAWQGSPPITLYSREGLPVVPFEIPIS
jgi:sialate O-acetylesterase